MKHKSCFLSFVASAALLCVSISPVLAKAPLLRKSCLGRHAITIAKFIS